VDEFVNKVWPFWMVVALCLGILSLAKVWQRPQPLPVVTVVVFCFLPGTFQFIRFEGGTMPMVFFVSLTALLVTKAIACGDEFYLAAAILAAAGCAMTKFEGIVYSAVWLGVLLPLCWRRGWLKKPVLGKSVLVAAFCLLPYVWLRLEKPMSHPESGWWHSGMATPASTLHRFPQA
jgi:4-amino-4-deoxy-L-arabinose transferase-like glycosyltransferase